MRSYLGVYAKLGVLVSALLGLGLSGWSAAEGRDIVVDASGGGDFTSVQAAIDAVPKGNTARVRILIRPGVYVEQIKVPSDKPFVSFIGLGDKPHDTVLTYNLNARSPKPDGAPGETVGTTGSTSTMISASDFTAENLTFANATPDNVAQAVAIKPQADRIAFRNCRFLGFQDTLYPMRGRQYYLNCHITGDVDFIFGDATAVFDQCTIHSSDAGYITAANTKPETAHGLVFLDCQLIAADSVKPNSVWLGRPWQWDRGAVASVTFIRTKMGPHIKAEGWHPWNTRNTDPAKTARYAEFASTDLAGNPLDVSKRVPWSRQLSAAEAAAYTVQNLLSGNDGWNPNAAFTPTPPGAQ